MTSTLPFWAMRFVAREKEGATKTGTIANMTLALIVTLIHLALLPVITTAFGLGNYVLINVVAAAHVIETYLISVWSMFAGSAAALHGLRSARWRSVQSIASLRLHTTIGVGIPRSGSKHYHSIRRQNSLLSQVSNTGEK